MVIELTEFYCSLYLSLKFYVHKSHVCDTAWVGHLHVSSADFMMLGTVMSAPVDVGLNPDKKG